MTIEIEAGSAEVSMARREALAGLAWDLGASGVIEEAGPEGEFVVVGFNDHEGAEAAEQHLPRWARSVGIEPAPALEHWVDPEAVVEVDFRAGFELRPGAAFGHGRHPTTVACLRLLDTAVNSAGNSAGNSTVDPVHSGSTPGLVLDLGTGTGVLTIAALRAGAARGIALDIDPAATAQCERNLANNDLGSRAEVVTGSVDAVADRLDRVDLVLANVLAPIHREVAPTLVANLAEGAELIVSGYLLDQADAVLALYLDRFEPVDEYETDGWIGHRLKSAAPPG